MKFNICDLDVNQYIGGKLLAQLHCCCEFVFVKLTC